jgi:hypothetical protein
VVALAAQWWPQLEDLRSHDGSLEPVAEHTQQHGDPLITDALLVVTLEVEASEETQRVVELGDHLHDGS